MEIYYVIIALLVGVIIGMLIIPVTDNIKGYFGRKKFKLFPKEGEGNEKTLG